MRLRSKRRRDRFDDVFNAGPYEARGESDRAYANVLVPLLIPLRVLIAHGHLVHPRKGYEPTRLDPAFAADIAIPTAGFRAHNFFSDSENLVPG